MDRGQCCGHPTYYSWVTDPSCVMNHRSLEWIPAQVSVTSSCKGRSQPKHKQRPRLVAVPAKAIRVRGVCPSDITNTHHFCRHTEVPRLLGSQREVRGGNHCGYPLRTTRHVCLNRGTPHETLGLKGRGCMCQTRGVEEPENG